MRALVTGGAGFVGRHLSERLILDGWDVVCVDPIVAGTGAIHPSQSSGAYLKSANFKFIELDCREFFNQNKANDKFDVIFHLAAVVGGRLLIEEQPLIVAQDLSIDAEMWSWAKNHITKRVCYFSSSAAYPLDLQGVNGHRILEEPDIDWKSNRLGVPDLSYGWAKLTGEFLAGLALEKHNLESVIYRPFSGYGTDQDHTYPFRAIIERGLVHQSSADFVVWGSGMQSRDFIHIDDCVERIVRTLFVAQPGEALNLSTGIATTFIELAKIVLTALDMESVTVKALTDKPEGVFYRVGDTFRQKTYLGKLEHISLEAGVLRAIETLQKV